MKRFIFILFYLFLVDNLYASHIKWYANFEKALIIAKNQKKDIMVFLIKKDSNDYKKMFLYTFNDKNIVKLLNKKYISIIVNFNDKRSYPIEMFYTSIFPTTFFISYKDESFNIPPLYGYIEKEEFKKYLK